MTVREMVDIISGAEAAMAEMADVVEAAESEDADVAVEIVREWMDSVGGLLRLVDGFELS